MKSSLPAPFHEAARIGCGLLYVVEVISFKNERVHGTRYATRAEAIADAFDYIEPFYNRRRRHSTLGYASPMKFLEDWISTQHKQQLAA